jgi:hypothetical protein
LRQFVQEAREIRPTEELQEDLGLPEKAVADWDRHSKDKLVSSVDPDARTRRKTGTTWPRYRARVVVEEE